MNTPWAILKQLAARPRRVVIVDDQRSWRAIEVLVGSLHVAAEIERVSESRHVGIMLPTSGLFPMSVLATWMLGRTVVPLNYLLKGSDLQYVCDDSEIDAIITVGPMLEFVGGAPRGPRLIRLDEMTFKGAPALRWPAWPGREDLAVLLYTSGTSGRPKGVMLSHGNITANIDQCCRWAEFGQGDVLLGVLPQFHVFGLTVLTLLPLSRGLKVVYTARFVPRRIIQLMRQHRPTAFMGIASMYGALLTVKDQTPEDWKSLRYVVSGGEPLPDAVAQEYRKRLNVTLNEGFGMTETSAVSHWCRPSEVRRHSVGRALPQIEQRVVEAGGRVCGVNEEGELRLRGPNMMQGYYKLPEETAAVFDEEGFLRTGDMARIDEDGFVYITGRIKEMMIIGGENVFPREIEEVLNKHPDVAASGVIGVRDESRGEAPVAFVELVEGAVFDETALRSHCRKFLAQYKVPRDIRRLEQLPRNPTGKIMRRELRVGMGDATASGPPAPGEASGDATPSNQGEGAKT